MKKNRQLTAIVFSQLTSTPSSRGGERWASSSSSGRSHALCICTEMGSSHWGCLRLSQHKKVVVGILLMDEETETLKAQVMFPLWCSGIRIKVRILEHLGRNPENSGSPPGSQKLWKINEWDLQVHSLEGLLKYSELQCSLLWNGTRNANLTRVMEGLRKTPEYKAPRTVHLSEKHWD